MPLYHISLSLLHYNNLVASSAVFTDLANTEMKCNQFYDTLNERMNLQPTVYRGIASARGTASARRTLQGLCKEAYLSLTGFGGVASTMHKI